MILVVTAVSTLFGLTMTAGYLVEQFVYNQNHWTLELQNPHLFTSSA
ncbi:hypothetical protein MRBLPE1_006271 [Paenibacillus sp. LPE1-1-1.1]